MRDREGTPRRTASWGEQKGTDGVGSSGPGCGGEALQAQVLSFPGFGEAGDGKARDYWSWAGTGWCSWVPGGMGLVVSSPW